MQFRKLDTDFDLIDCVYVLYFLKITKKWQKKMENFIVLSCKEQQKTSSIKAFIPLNNNNLFNILSFRVF